MFAPVRTRRSFEEALDQIVERITTGDLKVGDRLLSERDMAAQMGISRPTLREALKLLSRAGVIEVRSRSGGTVVRSDQIPRELISGRYEGVIDEVGGVLEVRRIIETNVARIAAATASKHDFEAMQSTIELQRSAADRDVAYHLQLDERFHLAMARATGNSMLVDIVRTIFRRIAIARDMTPRAAGDKALEIEIHERTLCALETRDPDMIEAAMDEHMSYLETVWERETGRRLSRPELVARSRPSSPDAASSALVQHLDQRSAGTYAAAMSSERALASSPAPSRHGATPTLWHPFADMAAPRSEVVIDRGSGVWVWDEQGTEYLDASAGLWYANVGHGRPEIARAIAAQLERIETHHLFGDYATRPALELAERLAQMAPAPDSRVFLVSGGGDAVDTAAKLVRLYWTEQGQPGRRHVISRGGAYHGTHGFGTSLGGIPANRHGYGPLIEDVSNVAHDSVDALRAEIDRLGSERVAAFIFEPVIASGGLLLPPPGYLENVTALCREHGILTIADEVACGFGRLGSWFGVERWSLRPDLIAFAKGVTSGYLPLGGVIVSGEVAEPFWSTRGRPVRHGPTYSGHAACCAAALANLDIMEAEGLLARARELEQPLLQELEGLADHPLVADVRGGVGLMAAFDLRGDLLDRHPDLVLEALVAARAAGVLTRPLECGLAVSPPLVVTRDELAAIGARLRSGLDALQNAVG